MSSVISFIVGSIFGGIVGVTTMCLLQINHLDGRRDDDDEYIRIN